MEMRVASAATRMVHIDCFMEWSFIVSRETQQKVAIDILQNMNSKHSYIMQVFQRPT